VKSSTRWAIGCTATVVALLVSGYALVAWVLAAAGCPIFRPGDIGASVAAARLDRSVTTLPGVSDVFEPDIRLSASACESELQVNLTFDQAATTDQVAAVLRRTVDGMQTPELAGFAGDVTFRLDDRGPDPAFEDGWFNLRWMQATRIPADSMLDEERAWVDLYKRYPGSKVALVNRWGTWEREVTVLIPDGDNTDADPVSEAFGVLRGLSFPERDVMSWQVCVTDDPTYRTVRSCEQVEGALPPE
jgi:hypothetical protein